MPVPAAPALPAKLPVRRLATTKGLAKRKKGVVRRGPKEKLNINEVKVPVKERKKVRFDVIDVKSETNTGKSGKVSTRWYVIGDYEGKPIKKSISAAQAGQWLLSKGRAEESAKTVRVRKPRSKRK